MFRYGVATGRCERSPACRSKNGKAGGGGAGFDWGQLIGRWRKESKNAPIAKSTVSLSCGPDKVGSQPWAPPVAAARAELVETVKSGMQYVLL